MAEPAEHPPEKYDGEPDITPSLAQPRVGIVVVHYNCLSDTLRCLRSISQLSYPNFFTIIVDSLSPDGSGEQLRAAPEAQNATLLLNPENCGFAVSTNLGIAHALVQEAQYVWLLNPDTVVDNDALFQLTRMAEHNPQAAAFGSKIYYGPGTEPAGIDLGGVDSEVIWGAGGAVDFTIRTVQMRGSHQLDRGQYDTARSCGYLPGCSMLVRSSLINEVGKFPEDYFMYFEETDWCTRIRKAGYQLLYVPTSRVWHYTRDDKMQAAFNVYYYNKNELSFWFRHGTFSQKFGVLGEVLFRRLPRGFIAFCTAKTREQRRVFFAHLMSCLDFLLGRAGKRPYFKGSI